MPARATVTVLRGYLEARDLTGRVLNDRLAGLLKKTAVSQARLVPISSLARDDGRKGLLQAIRAGLDETGYPGIAPCRNAAKYASAYLFVMQLTRLPGLVIAAQMDPGNARGSRKGIELILQKVPDMLMVKPAARHIWISSAV